MSSGVTVATSILFLQHNSIGSLALKVIRKIVNHFMFKVVRGLSFVIGHMTNKYLCH